MCVCVFISSTQNKELSVDATSTIEALRCDPYKPLLLIEERLLYHYRKRIVIPLVITIIPYPILPDFFFKFFFLYHIQNSIGRERPREFDTCISEIHFHENKQLMWDNHPRVVVLHQFVGLMLTCQPDAIYSFHSVAVV